MSRTVWKAVLKPIAVQEIEVPHGAEILCAREQHEQICVWFRCDPTRPKQLRKLAIVGTGHDAPQRAHARYIGTASLQGGLLMFHVFEQIDG